MKPHVNNEIERSGETDAGIMTSTDGLTIDNVQQHKGKGQLCVREDGCLLRAHTGSDVSDDQQKSVNISEATATHSLSVELSKEEAITRNPSLSLHSPNSNGGGAAVTFAMPNVVAIHYTTAGSNHKSSSPIRGNRCFKEVSSGSSNSDGGGNYKDEGDSVRNVISNNNVHHKKSPSSNRATKFTSNSNYQVNHRPSSGSNSATSSECNEASCTYSSNNPNSSSDSGVGVVTATTGNSASNSNTATSSGSGSDGGSGSASGGNWRCGDEASNEYYYAGFGSGSIGGRVVSTSMTHQFVHHPQEQNVTSSLNGGLNDTANGGMVMPTFASYHGASIAAATRAETAWEMHNNSNSVPDSEMLGAARHVLVAADCNSTTVGLSAIVGAPTTSALTHHSRHHLRHHHHHHHRSRQGPEAAGATQAFIANSNLAASSPFPLAGIPSNIRHPIHASPVDIGAHIRPIETGGVHSIRLPTAEEGVLERLPRALHASVGANDVPPPSTSSGSWSSGSRRYATRDSKKRIALGPPNGPVLMRQSDVASSVRINVGALGSAHATEDSLKHDSTSGNRLLAQRNKDDYILKESMLIPSSKSFVRSSSRQHLEAPTYPPSGKLPAEGSNVNGSTAGTHRRVSMSCRRGGTSDDSSDGARSDTEAVGSGSDEGYEASASSNAERQSGSGSSGYDSVSSDDVNKEKVSKARSTIYSNPSMKHASLEIQSNDKRTETSSMSSSVLADFSSVVNEENHSFTSSPRSSCTSLSSTEGNDQCENNKISPGVGNTESNSDRNAPSALKSKLVSEGKRRKRDSSYVDSSAQFHRKRQESDCHPEDGDIDVNKPRNVINSAMSIMEKSLQQRMRSPHLHHHYYSHSAERKLLEESFLSAKRNLSPLSSPDKGKAVIASVFESSVSSVSESTSGVGMTSLEKTMTISAEKSVHKRLSHDTSIYLLGSDVMALVLSFLEVLECHSILSSPLSKAWLDTYTAPQEIWKILCMSYPFYAKLEDNPCGSSDLSTGSFPLCNDLEMRHYFGRYRLLYTSFIRCMKYLSGLKDDALNGRTPSIYNNSNRNQLHPFDKNENLKAYFARARRIVRQNNRNNGSICTSASSASGGTSMTSNSGEDQKMDYESPTTTSSNLDLNTLKQTNSSGPRFGRSMLTDKLLRPTLSGNVANVNLPWSCAIYSVVNWMVAFVDVEGIQIMCLKVLPFLLEDEGQRTTAQRAGLTDGVLRAMVLFPYSIELHTAAFHALVLLARPLGGNEGMLFHTAMVNTRGIFNRGSRCSKNGIIIMLDSMRRFAQDEILQAMSCWSLVNVALIPLQKIMLVKLGGLTVTANAMLQHPYNAEVQFRALFALINLVIPSEVQPEETEEIREMEREIFQQLGEAGDSSTEKEMLDASAGQICHLVVVAMKNFCSSEAILNRACLVLHNLSLNLEYHSILIWTPNCYQMLEWCMANYPHDHVLQQSAGGTVQRLNATLSADDDLRVRFTQSIRAQQQYSLELARREAVYLQEQEERRM